MSMSTRISDLPGPSINEPPIQQMQQQQMQQQMQQQQMQQQQMQQLPNEVLNELSNININQIEQNNQSPSNIRMNIKKKVRFADEDENEEYENPNFLTFIKSQITEDNLLLLILFIVITRTEFDGYITLISPPYLSNPLLLNVLKAFVVLVFYLIMKQYFLPKIKL
jgi:hypothetical protein